MIHRLIGLAFSPRCGRPANNLRPANRPDARSLRVLKLLFLTRLRACLVNLGFASLLAGMAVALAACGSHTITKKDVIARGNQICQTAARSVRSVAPPRGESLPGLAQYYTRVTPIVQTEVKQLRALPRPAQDRALLNRYLEAVSSSATAYQALAAAAQAGDRGALESASAALRSNPAARLAVRYGITECGASPGTAAS